MVIFSGKAYSVCSAYKGLATINEASATGFVEIKLLDLSVPPSEYQNWTVKMCREQANGRNYTCDAPRTLGNITPLNNAYLVLSTSFLIQNQYFDILLEDSMGNTIDYFRAGDITPVQHTPPTGCDPAFDWDSTFITSFDYRREPDGIGDWNRLPGNSGGNSEGDTNDGTPPLVGACSIYFPDTIQGHNPNSELKFEDNGQVLNDPDNILTFPILDDDSDNDHNTCNSVDCTISSSTTPALSTPTFQTSSSSININSSSGATTIGVGGDYPNTEFNQLNLSGSSVVTFLPSATDYKITTASFTGNTQITFNAGIYWFDFLEILDSTQIIINGSVTIFVNQHFDIEDNALVNVSGPAQNLAFFGYDKVHLKNNVEVNAVIYGAGEDVSIRDNAILRGAISANEEVEIEDSGTVIYENVSGVKIANLCEGTTSISHYLIEHDGLGLTCESESITIKACTNADCSALSTVPVSLDFQADGITKTSPTFTGSIVTNLVHTTAEILTLSLANATLSASSPTVCDSGAGNSCDIVFSDTGFKFFANGIVDNIGNQIAGKDSNTAPGDQAITLKAVQTNQTTGQCDALINNATANIGFAYQCTNPISCAISNNGMAINTSQTVDDINIGYSNIPINFDNTGTGTLVLNYFDAGEISLLANATLDVDGSPVTVQGSSNSFIARPFAYDVQVTGNPNATAATDSVFATAGSSFETTIRSILWESADDTNNDGNADTGTNLSNNVVTPNISNITGNILLTPVAQVVSNSGVLGVANVNFSSFSAGIATVTQSWNEVGIMTINASTLPFMNTGGDVLGSRTNIGRFIPNHFVLSAPVIANQCGTFTYGGFFDGVNAGLNKSGQPFIVSGTITAENADNQTTQNYEGDFAKLVVANISSQGMDDNTGLNASGRVNFLSTVLSFNNGVSDYEDLASDFQFDTLIAPFNLRLDLAAVDSDGVTGLVSSNFFEVRNGRLRLIDAYGPETSDLEMPIVSDYFDGSQWLVNDQDNCTTYIDTNIVLDAASYTLQLNAGETGIFAPVAEQNLTSGVNTALNGLLFSAPGVDNFGSVDVNFDLTTQYWLMFDWDEDDNLDTPSAQLNFGYYRGSDRVIYWKEVKN